MNECSLSYLELVGIMAQFDLQEEAVLSSLQLSFSLQLCHQAVQQTLSFSFFSCVI